MLLLIVCPLLLILDVLLFLALRDQKRRGTFSIKNGKDWLLYGSIVILAQFPLIGLIPMGDTPTFLWGDAESHARVGLDIARSGLQNGWLDGRLAGFPFAQHYPPLGWLLHAGAVKLGASPIRAMQWIGFLFVFATPLTLFYCLGSLPGVRLPEASLAGIFVSWISPYNSFFGGYEVFFRTGLLSQTIGVPLILLWMREICVARRTHALVGYSLLAMAAHPQICIAGVIFLAIALLSFGALAHLKTFIWATLVLGVAGLALYGQGVIGMRLPFGWPAEFGWRQQGFALNRLSWWLEDGSLFDKSSTGELTSLVLIAGALSLTRLALPRVRAAALTFSLGLLLCVSGSLLAAAGPVGDLLLRFVQPLRLVSLVPPTAAALVALVAGAVADDLSRFFCQSQWFRLSRGAYFAVALGALGACTTGLSARLDFVQGWRDSFADVLPPEGYDRRLVANWLAEKPSGRIWYSTESRLVPVFLRDALSLETDSSIANTGAIGGHVGLHLAAYGSLAPEDPGVARRAEALGIRRLLLSNTPTPENFRELHRSGALTFVEHDQKTNLLGSGCIVRKYTGKNADLMARMVADLKQPENRDLLLDPNRLTQLEFTDQFPTESRVPKGECATEEVQITEKYYSTGRIEAAVESKTPFDLVLRMASFSSWQVTLDGKQAEWTTVAPGFLSIRVAPGSHRLVADASVWRNMRGTFTMACIALLGLILARTRPKLLHRRKGGLLRRIRRKSLKG